MRDDFNLLSMNEILFPQPVYSPKKENRWPNLVTDEEKKMGYILLFISSVIKIHGNNIPDDDL